MKLKGIPSVDYINLICGLYNDVYDDRVEDSHPPAVGRRSEVLSAMMIRDAAPYSAGRSWRSGQQSAHKSLGIFQKELKSLGITISTAKIRKILVTGGCYTTARSRQVQAMFARFTRPVAEGGEGLNEAAAVKRIAEELDMSRAAISINLPYMSGVYNLRKH